MKEEEMMGSQVISRYLSSDLLSIVKKDFRFLIDIIKKSGFEYDLQFRDNYLNLYNRGNSIGEIRYNKQMGTYRIRIHKKFVLDSVLERFKHDPLGDAYWVFQINSKKLHPLYSVANLKSMARKVKYVGYQEETTFEQMLITDNIGRKDLIIIDRQVSDHSSTKKIDLLALKQEASQDYRFCILEVKLGNNPELKGKVKEQLDGYINRIETHFSDYKKCYEKNIKQKQEIDLIDEELKINIIPGVIGIVVVGGYSGLAAISLKELKEKYPDIKVIHVKNEINFNNML